jgi:hypothetical protein
LFWTTQIQAANIVKEYPQQRSLESCEEKNNHTFFFIVSGTSIMGDFELLALASHNSGSDAILIPLLLFFNKDLPGVGQLQRSKVKTCNWAVRTRNYALTIGARCEKMSSNVRSSGWHAETLMSQAQFR